jgi:hypothetical protein
MSLAPTERIFATFKEGGTPTSYDPGDPNSYEQFIQALIADSRDYENSVLAPDRDTATKYYYGMLPSLNPDGSPYTDTQIIQDPTATFEQILGNDNEMMSRSTYVSTDVRDAVFMMLPSLIRIFASSENVVDLAPRTPNDTDMAAQATDYVNYVFWEDNPGFLILYGAFKDAMTVKTGFVKWWTDDQKAVKTKRFANISIEQLHSLFAEDPTAEIIDQGELDKKTGTISHVSIQFTESKPMVRVAGVPPEEMRLDRYALTFAKSRIVGHERIVSLDELTAMGYDRDQCANYLQSQDIHNFTMENLIRNPGRGMSTRVGDGVLYGEWYIWIDTDGDGVPELRYITTMGEDHAIQTDEPANRMKFAFFEIDPRSHTIVGDSLADLTVDLQRIKTNMWRGVLDSLAESINPKMAVNELNTNIDDALNDDLGAVIRTRGDPRNAVAWLQTPFVGQQAIPILQQLDGILQRRTGLSDAAKGLDPKVLQSSTMIGVEAIINGQQERTELVARVLAETGFKQLFQGLFNEIVENENQQRTLEIRGNWIPYDTSTFDASMQVKVNPTLGKGSDTLRMMTLQQIKQDQMSIFQQFGAQNPVVGIQEMLNTMTDMLAIANIKNVGRYFKTPSPQQLQAIMTMPKEPDAMTLAAKAQFEKVRSDTAQAVGQQQFMQQKQQSDDAFRHEQLRQKSIYDSRKLDIDAAKAGIEARGDGPPQPDPVESAKLGVDLHQSHLDAHMQERELQAKLAIEAAKIQQQREAAQLQAQTAMMRPNGNGNGQQ